MGHIEITAPRPGAPSRPNRVCASLKSSSSVPRPPQPPSFRSGACRCWRGDKSLLLPSLSEDLGDLLSLPLSPDVGSELLLGVLKSALVLSDPQELSNTLLVWSEAGDLLHDLSPELDPVREALIFKKKKGELVGQHLHRDIWSFSDTLHHRGGGGKVTFFFLSLLSAVPGGVEERGELRQDDPASSHRNGRATSPSPQPLDRRTRFPIGPDPRVNGLTYLPPGWRSLPLLLGHDVSLARPTAIPVAILQALLCQSPLRFASSVPWRDDRSHTACSLR